MLFKCLSVGFVLLSMVGCATRTSQFVSPDEFAKTRVVQAEARKLRAGDDVELAVEVNGSKEVPLSKLELGFDGTIPAPLVGDVDLKDKTLAEARSELEQKYRRIFTTMPLITLRMADDKLAAEWGYITVLGQVRNPGRYAIMSSAGMNLSDALHEAGGFGQSANMKEVIVSRQATDGKLVQCQCDITRLGRAGTGERDLMLFDGDVVQVPERLF